jgi:cyanate permease
MTATRDAPPRGTRAGLHRAWWVALVTLGVLVAAAGFRSSVGAMLEPLEETFGWSRATTSGAVSLNLVVYGVTAPFAAALIGRFGIRRVLLSALLLVAAGSGLTTLMDRRVAAVGAVGAGHRRRHRVDGPRPRRDRR